MKHTLGQELQLKDQAYNYIKRKIITCKFMPGDSISEQKIALDMGISRTPVREAVLRLSQEGLIMIYPRRGMVVSPVTVQDIHEVFQVRKMVEPYIATRYSQMMSRDELLDMNRQFEEFSFIDGDTSFEGYFDLDVQFHRYVIQCSKNQKLMDFMDKIYDLDYRIRALTTMETDDLEKRSKPEHHAIIEALINNDLQEIETAFNMHIDNALAAALRQV